MSNPRTLLGWAWPTTVVLVVCTLGMALTLGSLWRLHAQHQVDCEAQRAHHWATMPDLMTRLQAEADARRARLQAALDTARARSWWSWLVLPAHPADPGCQTMPF